MKEFVRKAMRLVFVLFLLSSSAWSSVRLYETGTIEARSWTTFINLSPVFLVIVATIYLLARWSRRKHFLDISLSDDWSPVVNNQFALPLRLRSRYPNGLPKN